MDVPAYLNTKETSGGKMSKLLFCFGCRFEITERYYLAAGDKHWHVTCLTCAHCRRPLATGCEEAEDLDKVTCFIIDGSIFCRTDYFNRLLSGRKCDKCQVLISNDDLVMKIGKSIFHVNCFNCVVCNKVLTTGNSFGLDRGQIFCRSHYESLDPRRNDPTMDRCGASAGTFAVRTGSNEMMNNCSKAKKMPIPGRVPGVRGRPRKCRDTVDQNKHANQSHIVDDSFKMEAIQPMDDEIGTGDESGKRKRMRSSFKQHQLKIMKAHFSNNQNPDAKDLREMASKTGLQARVIQVWFQNTRAKYRRGLSKRKCPPGDQSMIYAGEGNQNSVSRSGLSGLPEAGDHQDHQTIDMRFSSDFEDATSSSITGSGNFDDSGYVEQNYIRSFEHLSASSDSRDSSSVHISRASMSDLRPHPCHPPSHPPYEHPFGFQMAGVPDMSDLRGDMICCPFG